MEGTRAGPLRRRAFPEATHCGPRSLGGCGCEARACAAWPMLQRAARRLRLSTGVETFFGDSGSKQAG